MIIGSNTNDYLVTITGIQSVAIVYLAIALARIHGRLAAAEARVEELLEMKHIRAGG